MYAKIGGTLLTGMPGYSSRKRPLWMWCHRLAAICTISSASRRFDRAGSRKALIAGILLRSAVHAPRKAAQREHIKAAGENDGAGYEQPAARRHRPSRPASARAAERQEAERVVHLIAHASLEPRQHGGVQPRPKKNRSSTAPPPGARGARDRRAAPRS